MNIPLRQYGDLLASYLRPQRMRVAAMTVLLLVSIALPLLSPDAPVERREITIRTPFKGAGARDAFEMVTRATTEGRYTIDDALLALERGEILKGYVFVLGYRGKSVKLVIREGIVREEFILLGRKPDRTPEEDVRLAGLKQDMAERLLRLPADEVYDPV